MWSVSFGLALLFCGGFLVIYGGDRLVQTACQVGRYFGISSMFLGLTVVAFGTSAPELAVSLRAVLGGHGELAMANVLGSNVCNVLLVLGLMTSIRPLNISKKVLLFDVTFLVLMSFLLLLLSTDQSLNFGDGITLLCLMSGYVFVLAKGEKEEVEKVVQSQGEAEEVVDKSSLPLSLFWIVISIALLACGSDILVKGALMTAEGLGIKSAVVGFTVVALGTSLPEISTSIAAVRQNEHDMAIGNVLGSCIFNIGTVLGVSAVFAQVNFSWDVMSFHLIGALLVAVFCAFLFLHLRTSRLDGVGLITLYFCYLTYVGLEAVQSKVLPAFSLFVLEIVLPLMVVLWAGLYCRRRLCVLRNQGLGAE